MSISINKTISTTALEFDLISEKLQGNILNSHGRDNAWQLFISFKSGKDAKNCIRKYLRKRVTSAKKQLDDSKAYKKNNRCKNRVFYNLSLSASGLAKLGITDFSLFKDEFTQGAKSRIAKLKDPKESQWQDDLAKDWDCVFILASSSKKLLNSCLNRLKKKIKKYTLDLHVEIGEGIRNEAGDHIEHFGYVDGISQPHLLTDKVDGGKILASKWDPRAKLDLVLIKDPLVAEENAFGSYFVFRKLEQNVKAFREAEENLATKLGTGIAHAGAQMVGRFQNGMPLTLSPSPDPFVPPLNNPPGKMNDFKYNQDTNGSKCPFHAHIRKTNPRGSGGIQSQMKTPQMGRRGITYGIDFTKSNKHPEKGVGLLFMAHMADIEDQFEFMQASWSNNTNFPPNDNNKPTGIDPVIGQPSQTKGNYYETWNDPASRKQLKPSMKTFVTMKGGEYFFTPSISFLKSL